MAEMFPKRAPGELAGTFCTVMKCVNYARFAVTPVNRATGSIGCCAHHLSATVKGIMAMENQAVAIQEIPGNWFNNGGETAVIDGSLVRIKPPKER